ncbi:MAG: GDP-mannose 4,6-dehydratase [Bacteroidetes bacterium]|nr:GDP-mannose 4,6-dehydratase [Bacteroidota bacterium]
MSIYTIKITANYKLFLLLTGSCILLTEPEWQGEGVNEKGIVSAIKKEKLKILNEKIIDENPSSNQLVAEFGRSTINQSVAPSLFTFDFGIFNSLLGKEVVSVNPKYFRPTEVACPFGKLLIGDPAKAKAKLGWQTNTNLAELVKLLINSDFKKVIHMD